MDPVINGAIIPYYDEYLDGWEEAALGFPRIDARFVHANNASRTDGPDMIQQVTKIPKNNIYMHIERRITDPLVDTAPVRMELFIGRAFYKKERAIE